MIFTWSSKLESQRGEGFRALRRLARRFLRLTGTRSFVWADGFWWYRWHSDAGIGFTREWEKPIESRILQPGGCFVDVGSHVGRWTIRASPFYGKILAFEPDPLTNYVLRRNIARNRLDNIHVFATALSNHRDPAVLFNYGPPACNSLRPTHISGRTPKAGKTVRVKPLDDFTEYFLAPMVLKIDVEGEEQRVLEGGTGTLKEFKPMIVIEVHFQSEIELITEKMKNQGYNIIERFHQAANPNGQVYLVAKHSGQ